MQSLARRRRSVGHCSRSIINELNRRTRSFSVNHSLIDHPDSSEVLLEQNGHSRSVILNRPSFLNALTTSMVKRLQKAYESWEDTPDVGFVVMKANGRAFCAGADIVAIHDMIKRGNIEGSKEFFWVLYKFIYFLHTYLKPHVAILNGITMGGGAGISIPAKFRVVTEKTVYATPETLIGLHPDAGASFHLSHLPGHLGEYLALTGDILNGEEMIAYGLATHYSQSSKLPLIEECLRNLKTDDPSVIKTFLEKYSDPPSPDNVSVTQRMETINKCFSHNTVEEIIDTVENEAAKTHDGWCESVLKKLKYASPLSLKVSLRSIREGRFQSFDQCLIREYRLTSRAVACEISSDFREGVRARMVDKDFAPKWDRPSLDHVSQDMVDRSFSPLGAHEPELDLPTQQGEAFRKQHH
ncbi:3-hydroxyisobutyryl-CoA hydrolase-like protein 1, mitochondrial [Cynara cardunculus var. scolymus]|uniref:3-hydroxyisobutyryl-CoA hydrolase-like protein 1, mitochondrial n=1 Tax=Cynara cardunculus var. scolymus TaxID=59895 RepID=UPI000D62F762|nr:3-hydroxyisobutyryl-CoA hydrolase-like protein 1, mitochondrial [Cynara cardunculus var. scolymus]